MQAADAFWHIANFFAPAVVAGGIAAALARWIWRRELRGASLWRLWSWAAAAAAVVSVVGLVVFEHDGRMLTYAAMVVAIAVALRWSGWRRPRG